MATDKEFIVNRKFLIVFIAIQSILAVIILYALVSPKTVTVQVEKLDNAYKVDKPIEVVPFSL